jgi:hypothetical protein
MPAYRVFLDGIDTGDTVIAETFTDAYFDVASTRPLPYRNEVRLLEVKSPEDRL